MSKTSNRRAGHYLNLRPSRLFRVSRFVLRISAVNLTILLSFWTPAQAAEVRLRSAAGCSAAVVRVADVAEVFAEDARIANALAEITLCPAPGPGSTRTLSQSEVQQLLALSGVDRKA